jgi:hypothetical protein
MTTNPRSAKEKQFLGRNKMDRPRLRGGLILSAMARTDTPTS